MDMGFPQPVQTIQNALRLAGGDIEGAINLLPTTPDFCHDNDGQKHPSRPKRKRRPATTDERTSTCHPNNNNEPSIASGHMELINGLETTKPANVKEMPSLQYGFLVMILEYCKKRLKTLNDFCVVCDLPHVFQNGGMLKPAVCGRDLCIFSSQTLGVMADATTDIATGPQVVDLLMVMAKAACNSVRKTDIFDPYPCVIDPRNPNNLALCPKNPDYERCREIFNNMPSMRQLTQHQGEGLKNYMDKKDKLAYPLLSWLITSNRSHIVKLRKTLDFMCTPHQFLLMSSPPAKEEAFRKGKAEHGSTFAFHGSNVENWHSIMRNGLVNATGTKLQLHGASYGSGIYLSPSASFSFGYSDQHRQPAASSVFIDLAEEEQENDNKDDYRFLNDSTDLKCIALCEVVTSPKLLKHGSSIWTVTEPNHVCTRFFFVYENYAQVDTNIHTQRQPYTDSILEAVKCQSP